VRQNFLLKNILGLSHFSRTKALLQNLGIEQLPQLYLKHKIFFLKQIILNELSVKTYNFISAYFRDVLAPKQSFVSQVRKVESVIEKEVTPTNLKSSIESIEGKFHCNDNDLLEQVKCTLDNYTTETFFITINSLKELLWVEFYGTVNNRNIADL